MIINITITEIIRVSESLISFFINANSLTSLSEIVIGFVAVVAALNVEANPVGAPTPDTPWVPD